MNPRLFLLLAGTGVAAALAADPKPVVAPAPAAPVSAAPAAAAPRTDSSVAPSASFDVFRAIGDRNIFNAYRTGRRDRADEPPPPADTISFVGTMNSDKGLVAFFDSSVPAYRKVLQVGESVADFKVTKIGTDRVELDHAGTAVAMRLTQQLRRPPGADWSVGEMATTRVEASSGGADPSAPPTISASDDDVVKKMKERRRKELTK